MKLFTHNIIIIISIKSCNSHNVHLIGRLVLGMEDCYTTMVKLVAPL